MSVWAGMQLEAAWCEQLRVALLLRLRQVASVDGPPPAPAPPACQRRGSLPTDLIGESPRTEQTEQGFYWVSHECSIKHSERYFFELTLKQNPNQFSQRVIFIQSNILWAVCFTSAYLHLAWCFCLAADLTDGRWRCFRPLQSSVAPAASPSDVIEPPGATSAGPPNTAGTSSSAKLGLVL